MTRCRCSRTLLLFCLAVASEQSAHSQVYVISASAPVMSASEQIATVTKGQEFAVQQTNGPWLLLSVTTPGGAKAGWIQKDHTRRLFLPPAQPLRPTRRGDLSEIRPALDRIEKALDSGRASEVLNDAEAAVTTVWQLKGSDHETAATMEGILASVYKEAHLFPQAERFYRRVLEYDEAHPNDPEQSAIRLLDFGAFYRDLGQYAKAEPLVTKAIDLLVKKYGPDHIEVARWRQHLAGLYWKSGQYGKAEPLFQQIVRVYEAHYGKDHLEVAEPLNNLAALQADMGHYAEAEAGRLRVVAIKEAKLGPNHKELVTPLINLGSHYFHKHELSKAIATYERTIKIVEANYGAASLEMAAPLIGLASAHNAEGDYSRAETFYQRGLALQESRLGPNHLDLATTLRLLANFYQDTLQYQKAAPLFERSVKIREALVDKNDPELANSYLGLGSIYKNLKEFARAEPYYQRALAIHESRRAEDRDPLAYAFTLNNLGGLYKDMEQFDKAEPLYLRAIPLVENVRELLDHPETSLCVSCLGNLYQDQREYAKAEPLYERSVKANRARRHLNHPEIAAGLHELMWIYAATGRWKEAVEAKDQAGRIARYHIGRVLPGLSEKEQVNFLAGHASWFYAGQTLGVLRQDDPAVVARSAEWLLNGKGVVHAALAERALMARDATRPELARIVAQLRDVQNRLAALTQQPGKPEDAAARSQQIAQLTDEEQALAKQLGQAGSRAAQSGTWVELAAVRKALPPDSVLIDIANIHYHDFTGSHTSQKTDLHYVAWIVPPEGQGDVRLVELGSSAEIDSLVKKYGEAMGNAAAEILDSGEAAAEGTIRKQLETIAGHVLRPLEKEIARYRGWMISADWMLWGVPWSALPLNNGHWAIEDHRIQYATSGRDLVETNSQARSPQPASAVVFANPDFDLDPKLAQSELRRQKLDSALAMRGAPAAANASIPADWSLLPGTAEEAKQISPRLAALVKSAPQLLTENNALEGVFKQLQQPRVLVMSTHGYFLAEQPEASTQRIENPLLRCGLVLAGANRRSNRPAELDDGILTGLEIVGVDLRGTELVALSACETGAGELRFGEGVVGLRQAFQLAGAQAVVATLWQIPDRESAQLMTGFFTNLAENQTKADALRNAQLALIKTRREQHGAAHPFFWAAFTLTGT